MIYVYTAKAEKHGLGREGAEIKTGGNLSLKYLQVHKYCVANHDKKAPKPKPRARAGAVAKPPNTGAVSNPLKV